MLAVGVALCGIESFTAVHSSNCSGRDKGDVGERREERGVRREEACL